MKLLLCSPYLQSPGIISGGINMWAHNLLCYRKEIESDVEVVPVSFDRRNYVSVDTNMIKRMYLGIIELSAAIREAKRELDKKHIDVVHICTSASISLTKDIVLLKAAKKRGCKGIIHFHFGRIPDLISKNNWEWKLVKRCLSLASIAVTMDMKTFLALKNVGYKNVVYCPNPLSIAIINQIEAEKGKYERIARRLLFVGHVLPSKGVFELVKACNELDNIELHIVGRAEVEVKTQLAEMVKEKDNGEWLKFHGEIPHDEVLREMMKASIFVFPSYTEGFPNVILEAMACGCPIVTTTVGAIPEILDIKNGFNYGVCVSPKSVDSFRDAIKSFLDDEELAVKTGMMAKQRVNEMYALPIIWKKLVDIWKH